LPTMTLAPGEAGLWDGRFRVSVGARLADGPVEVRALGEANLRDLRRRGLVSDAAPARAAAAAPAMWQRGRIIAVPSLRYWTAGHTGADLDAAFVGIQTSDNASREP
jgi:hypothetical protein